MTVSLAADRLTETIIGAAIKVHRALGPGLLESAYEACLLYELTTAGLQVERQKPLPIIYKEVDLDCGYRLDLVVEDRVIVEIKAVEQLQANPHAQLLSYRRLAHCSVGLLINFECESVERGYSSPCQRIPRVICSFSLRALRLNFVTKE
jgi:GxxExxY protein